MASRPWNGPTGTPRNSSTASSVNSSSIGPKSPERTASLNLRTCSCTSSGPVTEPFCLNRGMSADASSLSVGGVDYAVWRVGDVSHLPFSLRILLENVLRTSSAEDAEAVRAWQPQDEPSREI